MRRLAIAVLTLALLPNGCGGSDEGDEGSARRASTAEEARPGTDEFVRRVDSLCRDANPALAANAAALTRARDDARAGRASLRETFKRFAALLRKADRTTNRLRGGLRAIDAPEQERAFHAALIDSLEKGSRNLREQISAAEAQDAVRLRELSVQGSLINTRGKGLIEGHGGFRHCGRA